MKIYLITAILVVCIVCVVSSQEIHELSSVKPYEKSTFAEGQADPTPLILGVNPLDFAGKRIDLDVRNTELPRAHENNYRFACRFPIIDYVSNNPLFMKEWLENNAERLLTLHKTTDLGVVQQLIILLTGSCSDPKIESDSYGRNITSEVRSKLEESALTKEFQTIVLTLINQVMECNLLCQTSLENLSHEDLIFFQSHPSYFLLPDGHKAPSLTGNVSTHFEFIEVARKVRFEKIFSAAEILIDAVESYLKATKDYKIGDFYSDMHNQEIIIINIDGNYLIIGSPGDDTYEQDAFLILDPAGNDHYYNNAAGSTLDGGGVAVVIDHNGNDEYNSQNRNFVQGTGFLGLGLLLDMHGKDTYQAGDFSQGAGVLGVGILDDREGDDLYVAGGFCQGAGMFGSGVLLEGSGEDIFRCATMGQGSATTLGIGLLSDLQGDDRYHLAIEDVHNSWGILPGYGQGGALSFRNYPWEGVLTAYGGVGLLLDYQGNDRFRTKGWCDQGGSYIMSLGALYDRSGNDHYTAHTGQGSGIHITNGILIDKEGHDIYEGGFRSGGAGGDRSVSILIDYEGNDSYFSKSSSYGTGCKPFSYSLMIDYKGDDHYTSLDPRKDIIFNQWHSLGGVWPESEPYLWPYAICLDLGGTDIYDLPFHENNSERHSFGHGIHCDVEWPENDIIGPVSNSLPPYEDFHFQADQITLSHGSLLRALVHPNTFVRFQAIGTIIRQGETIIPELVQVLLSSQHKQVNRDVMECLHSFLVGGKLTSTSRAELIKLLHAPDEEVRSIMTANMRIWKIKESEQSLLELLEYETSSQVISLALETLLSFQSEQALPQAEKLALDHPSVDVRRQAVKLLYSLAKSGETYHKLEKILETDYDESVRVEAVNGLASLLDIRSVPLLKKLNSSPSPYIRRAVGKALAEMGHIEGIEMLIESLSFPSINAFHNYDRNIPNDIASFTGFDLPEDKRYDQNEWRKAFHVRKESIDLNKNVQALHAFQKIQKEKKESENQIIIEAYEDFLTRFPEYTLVKKRLAGLLNRIAWDMVTAPEKSERFQPKQALLYAKRAVELEHEKDYVDTLAEAYFVNGYLDESEKICKDALESHPGENMFLERLQRIKKHRK